MAKRIFLVFAMVAIIALSGCNTIINSDTYSDGSESSSLEFTPNNYENKDNPQSGSNNNNLTQNNSEGKSDHSFSATDSSTTTIGSKENEQDNPSPPNNPASESEDVIIYPQLSESELKTAIERFPIDNISLPDGNIVSKYDAISADTNVLIFDFAIYRYASPIFKTTSDDPNLIKFTDGFWETVVDISNLDKQINVSYKKAVKGDVLENGLKVSGAICRIDTNGNIVRSNMNLSGSITVSGILNYLPEEDLYRSKGTLYFRPDSTKTKIPMLYSSRDMIYQFWDGYSNGEDNPPFYMYFDGVVCTLGSIYDRQYDKYDLKETFGDETTIAARLTVGNLKYSSQEGMSGEIIDMQI